MGRGGGEANCNWIKFMENVRKIYQEFRVKFSRNFKET